MLLPAVIISFLTISIYSEPTEHKVTDFCISNFNENVIINEDFYKWRMKQKNSLFLFIKKNEKDEFELENTPKIVKVTVNKEQKNITIKENIKFELILRDLAIKITETNKTNSKEIYVIDLKNVCLVIFKLILNKETKYILTIPDFYYKKSKEPGDVISIFSRGNTKSTFKELEIEEVFSNTENWKDFSYMFYNNGNIEKISIKNFNYNFKSINSAFEECSALKEITGLKYLFTENLKSSVNLFNGTSKLYDVDISDVKLPKDCRMMFYSSSIKNANMKNTDFINVEQIFSFFEYSDIESIDFSNVKNCKPKHIVFAFCHCRHLKNISLNKIDTSNCVSFTSNFLKTPKLRKIDLSKQKITSLPFIPLTENKEIILPNDKSSALICLKALNESNQEEGINRSLDKISITYHNIELKNFSKYDSPNLFISDPEGYLKNRDEVIERNKKEFNFNGPGCCTCCEKCCKSCNS